MKRGIFIAALLVCALAAGAWPVSAAKPIKTLVVTGQNNHNWQVSSVVIERILENSGLFAVDVAVSPPQGGDMEKFAPEFGEYRLVVLDYNGDEWSESTKAAFLEYVNSGGGLVIYHAADNAFRNWPEFNRMIALGGWEGRNEEDGPYLYVKNGQIVTDNSPGAGGSHGRQHEYLLDAFDTDHPVIKGLPAQWRHATDELYDRMRGPANIEKLLYTAQSSEETGGSGRREPLIFTVDYGRARIFHTMLGHAGATPENSPAMQCTGFQVTLLRGCEWAATGRVKQPIPPDFPTAETTSFRPDYLPPRQQR
jgi:type 1 glutamine amidotransferase